METSEWSLLSQSLVSGIIFGLIGGLAVWAQRWFKGEPLVQRTKLSSPSILYVGLAMFVGAAVMALSAGMPLFAAAFSVIAVFYIVLLVSYTGGWRG